MLKNTNELKNEIIVVEHAWLEAHRTIDLSILEMLMHPNYIIIKPGGEVISKKEALDSYKNGRQWEEASIDELDIRIYGDSAVVIGKWQAKGTNQGKHFDYSARYISVWVKHKGQWKIATDQSTEIK